MLGCNVPAERCQHDHGVPFDSGGDTCVQTNESLCGPDHQLKTHSRWRFHINPTNAECTWIAPTGHGYATMPPPLGGIGPPTRNVPAPVPGYAEEPPF